MTSIWSLLTLLLPAALATAAQPPPDPRLDTTEPIPEGTRILWDLQYAQTPDHKPLLLDLYLPATAATSRHPLPLVIFIHGGGWLTGSRTNPRGLSLLPHGYALASIDYRLATPFPAPLHDCQAAVRFLRARAPDYHLDPDRIALWGGSAGAHLAALLATTADESSLQDPRGPSTTSCRVQAVVDFFGPSDFTTVVAQARPVGRTDVDTPASPESKFLGDTPSRRPDLARLASPLHHVSPSCPPFLILHGDHDPIVPLAQSQSLAATLHAHHVPTSLHIIPSAGHGWGPEHNPLVLNFLNQYLAPKEK